DRCRVLPFHRLEPRRVGLRNGFSRGCRNRRTTADFDQDDHRAEDPRDHARRLTVIEIDGPTTTMCTANTETNTGHTMGRVPMAESGMTTKVMNSCTASPNSTPAAIGCWLIVGRSRLSA